MKQILLLIILLTNLTNPINACISVTDDFNTVNPTLNANFDLLPDIAPFTDCWASSLKIRSSKDGWRLVATRVGPEPVNVEGDPNHNIQAKDIEIKYELKNFGMADADGAILVSPFSEETKLSSINFGTLIVSGIKKSSNSCSPFNPSFYRIRQELCLFKDFIFNPGQYSGQISYLVIAP